MFAVMSLESISWFLRFKVSTSSLYLCWRAIKFPFTILSEFSIFLISSFFSPSTLFNSTWHSLYFYLNLEAVAKSLSNFYIVFFKLPIVNSAILFLLLKVSMFSISLVFSLSIAAWVRVICSNFETNSLLLCSRILFPFSRSLTMLAYYFSSLSSSEICLFLV